MRVRRDENNLRDLQLQYLVYDVAKLREIITRNYINSDNYLQETTCIIIINRTTLKKIAICKPNI